MTFSSHRLHSSKPHLNGKATALTRFVDENGVTRCGQRTDDGSTALLVENDDILGSLLFTGETATVAKILAPVVPSQILGIGLNYRKHAKETNMPEPKYPVLFTKGVNSLQHPHDPVVIPRVASDPPEVDFECELAVVLNKAACNVTEEEALTYVGGYTCANDISARRWQGKKGGGQWCRAKTFDTFCPLGPELVTPEIIPDPQTLEIATYLNGEQVQKSNTGDMIFSVAQLISQLSQDCTLPKGTLILTGTPEGVGVARDPPLFLTPGDMVEVEIDRIGKLVNPVVGASAL
ncbi:5-carboxymethyl-2-hydroxymuconate isomerase [Plasmopara halstedii]|uniref:5-carboxymethyl-2-hydroxymuconate isomerase n=1 Tax=Plasmopara halstedii TaxID=4781 RepID=A0A0P1B5G2_PLAHL|nr:5-carboxymethyl-2-hydroxymuconate isomerase [Plasmopara halstedii]CEG49582.1 5-carboxymethyl-2-hydroxymuconate isomerase [Plasmopara halstedii]|eukprot:XP_024585951.1 5-carboxymethyl-2-hydroxymuconate isomerase [Plasmopara halstedii]